MLKGQGLGPVKGVGFGLQDLADNAKSIQQNAEMKWTRGYTGQRLGEQFFAGHLVGKRPGYNMGSSFQDTSISEHA